MVAGSPDREDEATEANCFVVLLKNDDCEFFASVCGWKSQVLSLAAATNGSSCFLWVFFLIVWAAENIRAKHTKKTKQNKKEKKTCF